MYSSHVFIRRMSLQLLCFDPVNRFFNFGLTLCFTCHSPNNMNSRCWLLIKGLCNSVHADFIESKTLIVWYLGTIHLIGFKFQHIQYILYTKLVRFLACTHPIDFLDLLLRSEFSSEKLMPSTTLESMKYSSEFVDFTQSPQNKIILFYVSSRIFKTQLVEDTAAFTEYFLIEQTVDWNEFHKITLLQCYQRTWSNLKQQWIE